MLYSILLLCTAQLFCATASDEVIFSEQKTTWYLRDNLRQSTQRYGPGLHIFIRRPELTFLESHIILDTKCRDVQPWKGYRDRRHYRPIIRALHKDQEGTERQIYVAACFYKVEASEINAPLLSLELYTPKHMARTFSERYIQNMQKSPMPIELLKEGDTHSLLYPLPYNGTIKDDVYHIAVSASQDASLEIKYVLSKREGGRVESSFSFFKDESHPVEEIWPFLYRVQPHDAQQHE